MGKMKEAFTCHCPDESDDCIHYCHRCGSVRYSDSWYDDETRTPLCYCCANPEEDDG